MSKSVKGWLWMAVWCTGIAVLIWVSDLQPAARECAARGGRYYAADRSCGVFVFEHR
jgi:hypothetical protein